MAVDGLTSVISSSFGPKETMLSSAEPSVEPSVDQRQHRAPQNGAAKSAQAVQVDGLLPGVAVVVDAAVVLEAPPVPRPAGGTHAASASGTPQGSAAAAPARRGHPAIATYYDRWRAHYGKAPTITPKRVGILNGIHKGLGPAADVEYPKLLDALFSSTDRFIVDNAHSPEVFQTKLDTLRVNGNGSPLSVLGKHGEATMRAGLEWIRQTSGKGAGV